jgi:hypothetical protein
VAPNKIRCESCQKSHLTTTLSPARHRHSLKSLSPHNSPPRDTELAIATLFIHSSTTSHPSLHTASLRQFTRTARKEQGFV